MIQVLRYIVYIYKCILSNEILSIFEAYTHDLHFLQLFLKYKMWNYLVVW